MKNRPELNHYIETSISELSQRRFLVVRFIYNICLLTSSIASLGYIVKYLSNTTFFWDSSSLIYILLLVITIIVLLYGRLIVLPISTEKAALIILSLFVGISILQFYYNGVGTSIPSILIVTAMIVAHFVFSTYTSEILYLALVIVMVIITAMHVFGFYEYSITTTETTFQNSIIFLFFLWIIKRILFIEQSNTNHTYNRIFEYSQMLESIESHQGLIQKRISEKSTSTCYNETSAVSLDSLKTAVFRNFLHDISVPISSLLGTLSLMQKKRFSDVENILGETENAARQVIQMINNAKLLFKHSSIVEQINVKKKLISILSLFEGIILKEDISIKYCFNDNLFLEGCSSIFCRIMINVIGNAFEELSLLKSSKGVIWIRCFKNNGIVVVVVENEFQIGERMIDPPFFKKVYTSKNVKSHDGEGLLFVKSLLKEYFKGDIYVKITDCCRFQVSLLFEERCIT